MSEGTNQERLDENNALLQDLKTEIDTLPDYKDEDVYSLEERVVGRWINNKPLYRKVIRFNNYVGDIEYSLVELNIEEPFLNETNSYTYHSIFGTYTPLNFYEDNRARSFGLIFPTTLKVQFGDAFKENSKTTIVTIEYTKTTD